MDKTVRVYDTFGEMKADEYRYWQSRPAYERWTPFQKWPLPPTR
jgi:hypothetical protein